MPVKARSGVQRQILHRQRGSLAHQANGGLSELPTINGTEFQQVERQDLGGTPLKRKALNPFGSTTGARQGMLRSRKGAYPRSLTSFPKFQSPHPEAVSRRLSSAASLQAVSRRPVSLGRQSITQQDSNGRRSRIFGSSRIPVQPSTALDPTKELMNEAARGYRELEEISSTREHQRPSMQQHPTGNRHLPHP